ncbi:hypothetical protein FRC20_009051 [Serendipita sp. 405]|nr:hypothetical protein FRC20_009051 [Serendipita sp. 405]
MHLLSLPTEIITQIFLNLTWKDILKSKSVCKAVYELSQSTALQYHVLLGIAGYRDGPSNHPMSKSQRLGLLRRLESSFNYGDFSQKERIPLSGYTPTYQLQSGIFLQGRHALGPNYRTSGVNVFRLPSASDNRDGGVSWKLPDLVRPIRDLDVDPIQDLLVLIEGGLLGSTAIETSFVSLTTGDPHPLSSGSYTMPISTTRNVASFTTIVMGSLMGLLVSDLRFIIYDWKKGKTEVDLPFDNIDPVNSFFFLDQSHFGLIRGGRRPAQIEIHKLKYNEEISSGSDLTAVYHLLAVKDNITVGEITCRSDPPPNVNDISTSYTDNQVYSTPPFIPRLEDRVLILEMMFWRSVDLIATCVIAVRAETLMKIPEKSICVDGVYVVTADLWMDETHMQPSMIGGNWACFVYGSRFVTLSFLDPINFTGEPDDDDDDDDDDDNGQKLFWPVEIFILDMNPRLVAWAESKGCDETPFGINRTETIDRRIRKSSELVMHNILQEPWHGGCPAIATRFIAEGVTARAADDFAVMLDGERLIIVKLKVNADHTRLPLYMDIYHS